MKNKILWFFMLLPVVVTAIAMPFMPEQVPMHYNLAGEIDRWGSKYEEFLFPAFIILYTGAFYLYLRYLEKKSVSGKSEKERKEAASNSLVVYYATVGVTILFNVIHYVSLYTGNREAMSNATHMEVDILAVTNVLLGILCIVLGNYMPKTKKNRTVGLRTSWSMHNDMTWATSNRFGGRLFVVAGFIMVVLSFILDGLIAIFVTFGIIVLVAIVATVYSYKMYQKYKDYETS